MLIYQYEHYLSAEEKKKKADSWVCGQDENQRGQGDARQTEKQEKMENMLPKINRLKKKKDFERVFKQGRGLKQDFLSLKFAKNNLEATRFGFVVGQKVSRKAVVRNKVKRRLREIARINLGNIKKGLDIVVVAGKGAELGSPEETVAIFNHLLKTV